MHWVGTCHNCMPRLKSVLKRVLVSLLAIVFILAGIWIWIGIRIGIWTYPQYDRHIWLVENIPVARAFWRGDIKVGDNVDELIKQWPPSGSNRFDPWVILRWEPGDPNTGISFIGISAVAKNGVLVCASAYSDDRLNDRIFFNTMTTNDGAEFYRANRVYSEKLEAQWEKAAQRTNGMPPSTGSSK